MTENSVFSPTSDELTESHLQLEKPNLLLWFVKFKTHLLRAWGVANIPLQFVNFGGIIYLTVKQANNDALWLLVPFVLLVGFALLYLDYSQMFKMEIEYQLDKTPYYSRIEKRLEKIEQLLKTKEDAE